MASPRPSSSRRGLWVVVAVALVLLGLGLLPLLGDESTVVMVAAEDARDAPEVERLVHHPVEDDAEAGRGGATGSGIMVPLIPLPRDHARLPIALPEVELVPVEVERVEVVPRASPVELRPDTPDLRRH